MPYKKPHYALWACIEFIALEFSRVVKPLSVLERKCSTRFSLVEGGSLGSGWWRDEVFGGGRVTGALQDGRVRRGRCTPRHARARACARARAPRRIAAAEGAGRRLTLAGFVQRTFNQEEVQLVVKEVRRSVARRAARGRVTRAARRAHRHLAMASGSRTACSFLPRLSCESRLCSPPPDCVALAPCPL